MLENKQISYSYKTKIFPMKFFMFYLVSTFIVFLVSDASSEILNFYELMFYVTSFYSFLFLGYWLGVKSKKISTKNLYSLKFQKKLIIIGAIYFIAWGVNLIVDFGATDFSQILRALTNPGEAYQNKFDIFEARELSGQVNRVTQFLLLLSFISSIFVILLILNWNKISFRLKVLSIFSIIIYMVSYLFIGTQKGLGDVIVYFLVGVFLLLASGYKVSAKKKMLIMTLIFVVFSSMFVYMVINQGSRATVFGQNSNVLFKDIHNTAMSKYFNEEIAFGFYNTISYPSHGYLGLSYNLQQNFEFSSGAGLSPAYESYRAQYFGGTGNLSVTYPFRTEVATGWPAGMYWATAFPWFASDLTFPGTIVFMFIIGFIFARTWIRAISQKDILAYALLGQLFMMLFYLPANNQVFMQRQGFLIILSIIILAVFRGLRRGRSNV